MAKKFDSIVEAVQYSPEGQLTLVRIYERRGAAFSDRVLLKREELIQRLKAGKRFVVGQRTIYMAGTFETGAALKLAGATGQEYVTTGPEPAGQDRVEAPRF
ncbi:MAG TPA: hypothetical protein VFF78_08275 [Anaerolineaceae bacterium]|nr:hypothetical protein [Anaerolineaceae bacterium]